MPKKIRELRRALLKAGFQESSGKGSHRIFRKGNITWPLSGNLGDDAEKYQEKAVAKLIEQAKKEGE